LVIGLGSGITVGSAATHAAVHRLDVLEISPEVVAASRFFVAEHGDVLSDPRLNMNVADARNFILAENQSNDVIISEPSNPWIRGISNLFTLDFFEMARTRLADGGIMAQWLQTYRMSVEDVKTVLHTFQAAFAHVSVWMPMKGDLITDRFRKTACPGLSAIGRDACPAECIR
jgi:spermidine synthase